jgi:hypothetical protein
VIVVVAVTVGVLSLAAGPASAASMKVRTPSDLAALARVAAR